MSSFLLSPNPHYRPSTSCHIPYGLSLSLSLVGPIPDSPVVTETSLKGVTTPRTFRVHIMYLNFYFYFYTVTFSSYRWSSQNSHLSSFLYHRSRTPLSSWVLSTKILPYLPILSHPTVSHLIPIPSNTILPYTTLCYPVLSILSWPGYLLWNFERTDYPLFRYTFL